MALEKLQMIAKTFAGLEEILKEELIEIGATDVEVAVREVRFSGSKEILYKANFCCRTALRILLIIKEKKVKSATDLYNCARGIEWSNYFDVQKTFTVSSSVDSEAFNSSMIVSLKTKDAIVDHFKTATGKRPSVNNENPDIRIYVHATADEVSLSLDSSGESLHKRGYRNGQDAPVCEVLVAGILKIAGWKGQCDFFDPMCGIGTMAIEAALIARKIPPGIFRKSFGFENWKDFDETLFDSIYNSDYEIPFDHQIFASDISSGNVKLAIENAKNAGLKKDIQFSVSDFSSIKPNENKGFIIFTPLSAQRGNDNSTETLFSMIGDTLKKNFVGFNVWVFSNSEEGFRNIGLRFTDRIELINGSLECELRSYELYSGARRDVSVDSPKRSNFNADRKNSEQTNYIRENRTSQTRRFSSDDRKGEQGRRFPSSEKNEVNGRRIRPVERRDDQPHRFSSDDKRERPERRFSTGERNENREGRFSSERSGERRQFSSTDRRAGQRRISPEERKEGIGRISLTEDLNKRTHHTEKSDNQVKRISSVEKRAEQERQFISGNGSENPKRKFTPGVNSETTSDEKKPKRPRRIN